MRSPPRASSTSSTGSDELPDPVHPEFRKGDGHQGQPDAVLAERRADQQAAGDRRRRFRPLPADPRPRAAVQGPRRAGAVRHQQAEERRQPASPRCSKARPALWTWDGGLYHLPHCWGSRGDLLAHRSRRRAITRRCQLRLALGRRRTRARCRAGRIRCCSASACGWTATASCRPTACSTPSRTRRPSRRSTTRSCRSRSSTSRGSSSSGIQRRQHQVRPARERRV